MVILIMELIWDVNNVNILVLNVLELHKTNVQNVWLEIMPIHLLIVNVKMVIMKILTNYV